MPIQSRNFKAAPMIILLSLLSLPLLIMCFYLIVDTITNTQPGTLIPDEITFEHWRFLWQTTENSSANIWRVTLNTFVFSITTATTILAISLTAGYALSRLNIPFRRFFLSGLIMLHAFPTITLIIAIFLILQTLGLYDSLIGVIMVKSALELPFGIWIMKGFYDNVPWEIEMAGVQDGASRFTVWRKLVLPQVQPGMMALLVFSFLTAWSELVLPLVLAPGNKSQVLSVYLATMLADERSIDFNLMKSVGLFYVIPVVITYMIFQRKLMNIYGGGTKG